MTISRQPYFPRRRSFTMGQKRSSTPPDDQDRAFLRTVGLPLLSVLLGAAIAIGTTYATINQQGKAQIAALNASHADQQRELASKAYLSYLEAYDAYFEDIGVYKPCALLAAKSSTKAEPSCQKVEASLVTRTIDLESARRQVLIYGSNAGVQLVDSVSTDAGSAQAELTQLENEIRLTQSLVQAEQQGTGATGVPGCGVSCALFKARLDSLKDQASGLTAEIGSNPLDDVSRAAASNTRGKLLQLMCREASPEPRSAC